VYRKKTKDQREASMDGREWHEYARNQSDGQWWEKSPEVDTTRVKFRGSPGALQARGGSLRA